MTTTMNKETIDALEITANQEITLSSGSGDIRCTLVGTESDYAIDCQTKIGFAEVPHGNDSADTWLTVRTNYGDIEVSFPETTN